MTLKIMFHAILRDFFAALMVATVVIAISLSPLAYAKQNAKHQEASSGAHKVAIFPFEEDTFDAVTDQIYETLQAMIRSDRSLRLVFSYYNDALNDPPIANPATLWVGGKPNVELIVKLGRSRGADAVILGRLEDIVSHSAFAGSFGTDMQLYLIDLDSRAVYRRNGTTGKIKKLTQKLVVKFIAGGGSKRAVASKDTTPTRNATPPSTTAVKRSGDFAAGMRAYKQGDNASALREWTTLAEQGDARAQNGLGDLYSFGKGVPKESARGTHWYYKAAVQGYAIAQNNFGIALQFGNGVKKDEAAAAKWYQRAAARGLSGAQIQLARMYRQGRGVRQNYRRALRWYRKAAAQGDNNARTVAQLELADMYRDGLGVPQDKAQALQWYRQAATQGYASAQYKLGEMYRYGEGVTKDLGQARKFYQAALKSDYESIVKKATAALKEIDRELVRQKRAQVRTPRTSVPPVISHARSRLDVI